MTEDLDDKPIYMRKEGRETLRASSSDAIAEVGRLKDGERCWITIRRSRSSREHRWFRKFLQVVAEATHFDNDDIFLLWLKERLGYYDMMTIPAPFVKGETIRVRLYKSTSFGAMGPRRFSKFKQDAVAVTLSEVLPASAEPEIFARVEAMLEPTPPQLEEATP